MARDKHSDKDRPLPPEVQKADVQKADVQKAHDRYSATEQGDDRRAKEQPVPDVAPGQEAERGANDPDHEHRRYELPDRKPPKARSKAKRAT